MSHEEMNSSNDMLMAPNIFVTVHRIFCCCIITRAWAIRDGQNKIVVPFRYLLPLLSILRCLSLCVCPSAILFPFPLSLSFTLKEFTWLHSVIPLLLRLFAQVLLSYFPILFICPSHNSSPHILVMIEDDLGFPYFMLMPHLIFSEHEMTGLLFVCRWLDCPLLKISLGNLSIWYDK